MQQEGRGVECHHHPVQESLQKTTVAEVLKGVLKGVQKGKREGHRHGQQGLRELRVEGT